MKKNFYLLVMLLIAPFITLKLMAQGTGTWIPVANVAPGNCGGVMLLLSDGSVMAKSFTGPDSYGNAWNRLKPDIHGSYANGTWSALAPMNNTRLYFSSQVLKDGRVFIAGGEYGSGNAKGETYEPLTNTWTQAPNPGKTLSDANSEILEDGRILEALVTGDLKGNKFFSPTSNTWSDAPSCNGIHNESVWVKLKDKSILFVDRLSTTSERYIPSLNQWVVDANVPVSLYDSFGDETGAALLLPDGRAFFLGSPGTTAYYTPSGTNSPGTWQAGPSIPGNKGTPDAAAAMMVNGKILCAVSPKPVSGNVFQSPTTFYEFNYLTNTFTSLTAPDGSTSINEPCYYTNMLDLPDGTVLLGNLYSPQYYIYKPVGEPLAAGKPVINIIHQNDCGASFTITGTLFNGISEGASFGDDWQMNTNYPVIRLTSASSKIYYARTYNWNSTGVQRGNLADTAQFTLPAGLPVGSYSLVVTANGISSDPVTFINNPKIKAMITPLGNLDICAAGSVVLQANASTGYTYKWQKGVNLIAGATNQNYTATTVGSYKVTVTNSNGCSKLSKVAKVTKSCKNAAMDDNSLVEALSIFPNPAETQTTIQFTLSHESNVSVRIFDLSGKEIETLLDGDQQAGSHSLQLNISRYAKGAYYVKLVSSSGTENAKFIVE